MITKSTPNGHFSTIPEKTIMNTITSTSFRAVVAGTILSALAISFATVSGADERTTVPQVRVSYADLDVSSAQGAAVLYRRIQGAAGNVCWRMYSSTEAYKLSKDACLQKVISDAVSKVNAPALSAVFASKYGVSAPVVVAAAGAR
jgi:UrcA family protein